MSTQKIDLRLREEIERLEQSGASGQRLPVIVEPEDVGGEPVEGDTDELEHHVHAANTLLLRRLAHMGITDAQPMTLARAVVADLTPAQIRALAADSAVKRLLWNVSTRVTL
jgi:hypothetical protein